MQNGLLVAGGNGKGNRSDQLNEPRDVIVDKETGNIIICDFGNRRVMRWSQQYEKHGETLIKNIDCRGLTMDKNGFLYVTDETSVRRYEVGDMNGIVVAGGNGYGFDRLDRINCSYAVCVDQDSSIYVTDYTNDRVLKWKKGAQQGIVVAGGRKEGNGLAQLAYPTGVIIDQSGALYIGDKMNNRIVRWSNGATEGIIIVGDDELVDTEGLSLDQHGNLYVADRCRHRIRRFSIVQ